jgi:hypothetical protein
LPNELLPFSLRDVASEASILSRSKPRTWLRDLGVLPESYKANGLDAVSIRIRIGIWNSVSNDQPERNHPIVVH